MTDQQSPNVEQFARTAQLYDAVRPRPPQDLVRLLTLLCLVPRPSLVVDLGCGTGLSTRIWAGLSEVAIGLPEFRDEVNRVLGGKTWPWHVSYDVRYGIR